VYVVTSEHWVVSYMLLRRRNIIPVVFIPVVPTLIPLPSRNGFPHLGTFDKVVCVTMVLDLGHPLELVSTFFKERMFTRGQI
jgi:hypothetical protein